MASNLAPSGSAAWLPVDVRLDPAAGLRGPDGRGAITGGQPLTLLRLSPVAVEALEAWFDGEPVDRHRAFARGLVDRGMATPRPGVRADPVVVIPVRDRAGELAELLARLEGLEVLVVDDGSQDPDGVAAVVQRFGAKLLRLETPRGPAGARNAAIAATSSELLAFIDSDVLADAELVRGLAGAFIDPKLAAIAPRIEVLATEPSLAARYDAGASPLDMGPRSGPVVATSSLAYLPAALLVVRRSALGEGFDEELRFGEDVDLIWRMLQRGWLVRYDAERSAVHPARATLASVLRQRFDYASSAGVLAERHPAEMAAMRLHPLAASLTALLVLRRPVLAAAVLAGATASTARDLVGRVERPVEEALATMPPAAARGVEASARSALRTFGPFVAVAALLDHRLRRIAVSLVVLAHGRAAWRRRHELGALPSLAGDVAGDLAYAAGLWRGSIAARSTAALRVALQRRGAS